MIYGGTTVLPQLYMSVLVCLLVCVFVCVQFEFTDGSELAQFSTEAPKLVDDSYSVQCV